MFQYVGSKHRMAKWLAQFYPEHDIYCEPFGGAGTMFFYQNIAKKKRVYNDLNKSVYNLFKVLQNEEKTQELIRMFKYAINSVAFSLEAWENYENKNIPDVERAFYTLYLLQTGRGYIYKYASLNGVRNLEFDNEFVIEKIKQVHEVFKNIVVENVNWQECFERYDSPKTFFYCDPPYITYSTNRIYHKELKFGIEKHKELIKVAKECNGMVIISGYEHPVYEELEKQGWIKKQFKTRVSFNIAESKDDGKRVETIWIKPNCLNKIQQFSLIE